MIRTIADLLREMLQRETAAIKRFRNLKHGPLIGEMYEGLTRSVTERVVFSDLDLRVASGKIVNEEGTLTNQIDCMVVEGEGERIPHTSHFVYRADRVIAAIEVKKNLYRTDLGAAYDNLLSVREVAEEERWYRLRSLRGPFRMIARRDIPASGDLESLPDGEHALALELARDVILPLRMVFAYQGFSSEHSLREAFVAYVGDHVPKPGEPPVQGFSLSSLPNLVLCDEHALVKTNGMPYALQLTTPLPYDTSLGREGWWPIYASATKHSAVLFLEVLWSRLAERFQLGAHIFGDDLDLEKLNPLLLAKPVVGRGWLYCEHPMSKRELEAVPAREPWAPVELNEHQFVTVSLLCKRGLIDIAQDADFRRFAEEAAGSVDAFVAGLVSTGLVYVDDKQHLQLLTFLCRCALLPGGRMVAGEDETGRFTRWVLQQGGRPQSG